MGIGYGPSLLVGDEDIFGNELNLASKLGEDMAEPNEILLTEAAALALPDAGFRKTALELRVSGMAIMCVRLEG